MLTTRPYLRTRRPSPTTVEFVATTRPVLTTPLRVLLYSVYLARVLLGLGIVLLLFATWEVCPLTRGFGLAAADNKTSQAGVGGGEQGRGPPATSDEVFWHAIYYVLHSTAPGRVALNVAVAAVGMLSPTAAAASAVAVVTASSSVSTIATSSAITIDPPVPSSSPATTSVLLAWLALPPIYILALHYLVLRRIHTEERLLVLRGLGIQTSSSASTVLGSSVTRFIPTDKIQDVLINEAFRGFEVRHYLIVIVEGEEDVIVVFPKLLPGPNVVERVWRGVRKCLYEQHHVSNGIGHGIDTCEWRRSSGSTSPDKEGSPTKR